MDKVMTSLFEYLKIYKGKNVLVTGHTGFKGTWLSTWLIELGANVVGYALDPINEKDIFNLNKMSESMIDIRADIRDYDNLLSVVDKYNIEIVFHLAAQPIVLKSYDEPKYTFEVNVLGTLNVLEAIRNSRSVKSAVIITTDKVYEYNEKNNGYNEDDKLGGYDPYSSSKAACEFLVDSYIKSFFSGKQTNICSVRAGNVVGGGDWSENRLIPDCIRAYEKNKSLEIRNPNYTRPWQHVIEPLAAYLELGSRLFLNQVDIVGAWNIGPNPSFTHTVDEVITKVKNELKNLKVAYRNRSNSSHESKLLKLDINKAVSRLHWNPIWALNKTLDKTIYWYLNYKEKDSYLICLEQITEYIEDASLNNKEK